jgi:hypothetical protein
MSLAYYAPLSQLSTMADAVGLSGAQAAALVAGMGLFNLVGRYGAGYVVSDDAPSVGLRLSTAVVGLGVVILGFATWRSSPGLLIAGTATYGVGSGGFVVALPVAGLLESLDQDAGRALGVLYLAMAPGAMLGPIAVSHGLSDGGGQAALTLAAIGALALVGSSMSELVWRARGEGA